jgi:hypothetical protein
MHPAISDVDPFDLPDWLGTEDVVWRSDGGLHGGHLVPGRLTGHGHEDLACDLFAVDEAYPAPVTDDASRLRTHQAWRHDQVLVGRYGDRLVLAAPGAAWTAERCLDVLDRLARAVGARPERFAALLRVGG